MFYCLRTNDWLSERVVFITAHQHILGYSMFHIDVEDANKNGKTVKMKIIIKTS